MRPASRVGAAAAPSAARRKVERSMRRWYTGVVDGKVNHSGGGGLRGGAGVAGSGGADAGSGHHNASVHLGGGGLGGVSSGVGGKGRWGGLLLILLTRSMVLSALRWRVSQPPRWRWCSWRARGACGDAFSPDTPPHHWPAIFLRSADLTNVTAAAAQPGTIACGPDASSVCAASL